MTDTNGIRIRPTAPTDRPALVAFMAALEDNERRIEPDLLRPGADMAESHVAHLLEMVARHDGIVLIAEEEGSATPPSEPPANAPLGFLIAYVEEDHGTYLVPEARRVGRVTDLFVAPKARRRGLAHRLIAAAEDHFRALRLSHMQIGVLARNTTAQAVYEAAGYRDWLHIMERAL